MFKKKSENIGYKFVFIKISRNPPCVFISLDRKKIWLFFDVLFVSLP